MNAAYGRPSNSKHLTPAIVDVQHFEATDSRLKMRQKRPVVEARSEARVVRAQRLFTNNQRALVQCLRFVVVVLLAKWVVVVIGVACDSGTPNSK